MSSYNTLPIFKSTKELMVRLRKPLEQIKKPYKFEIAKDIRETVVQMLLQIYEINRVDDKLKVEQMDIFATMMRKVEIMIQLCYEMKLVTYHGPNSIYLAMEKLEEIRGQIYKWRTYVIRKNAGVNKQKDGNTPEVDKPRNVVMLSKEPTLDE